VAGASNKAIAARLNLSENTIKTHLSRIFAKLDVQSRAEAVAAALTRGLVSVHGP
jgi:DNA-binding NarL/FixJ family response regulator